MGLSGRSFDETLELMIQEVECLLPGETFQVKDLFRGYEWNRMSRNERSLVSGLFGHYVSRNQQVVYRVKDIVKTVTYKKV